MRGYLFKFSATMVIMALSYRGTHLCCDVTRPDLRLRVAAGIGCRHRLFYKEHDCE